MLRESQYPILHIVYPSFWPAALLQQTEGFEASPPSRTSITFTPPLSVRLGHYWLCFCAAVRKCRSRNNLLYLVSRVDVNYTSGSSDRSVRSFLGPSGFVIMLNLQRNSRRGQENCDLRWHENLCVSEGSRIRTQVCFWQITSVILMQTAISLSEQELSLSRVELAPLLSRFLAIGFKCLLRWGCVVTSSSCGSSAWARDLSSSSTA